jgi:hypothetical protein
MWRAPWDKRLMLRRRVDPMPVAEGEVGRIVLLQRRPGHCRARLYLARDWQDRFCLGGVGEGDLWRGER